MSWAYGKNTHSETTESTNTHAESNDNSGGFDAGAKLFSGSTSLEAAFTRGVTKGSVSTHTTVNTSGEGATVGFTLEDPDVMDYFVVSATRQAERGRTALPTHRLPSVPRARIGLCVSVLLPHGA